MGSSTGKYGCILLLLLFALSCSSTRNARKEEGVVVQARQWSKVDGTVHYSDWKAFPATTLKTIPGFKPVESAVANPYGGDPVKKFRATGFFYTIKDSGRWWIVDPTGHAAWNVAVNGVRPGGSRRNEEALLRKFGSEENWIRQVHQDLDSMGFNGTACWSEVPLVKYSNLECKTPLSYTVILNLFSGYYRQVKKREERGISFPVFDTGFVKYVGQQAALLAENRDDPNLLGYFSDNELGFSTGILDEYLSVADKEDPNHLAATGWLRQMNIETGGVNDSVRELFLGVVAERYYMVVSEAIRKYDPNHMYLGSRLHGKPKHNAAIVAAAGKYCDILSINYYGHWEPVKRHFREWSAWADKPVIITEFYIKGDDSNMQNNSGAGWRVRTQEDRGVFYENFCIRLLQMKNCVGWNWFRYMDNDPTDSTADQSNRDSNKGLVDSFYEYYTPLVRHMLELNRNRYELIRYFDDSQSHTEL